MKKALMLLVQSGSLILRIIMIPAVGILDFPKSSQKVADGLCFTAQKGPVMSMNQLFSGHLRLNSDHAFYTLVCFYFKSQVTLYKVTGILDVQMTETRDRPVQQVK